MKRITVTEAHLDKAIEEVTKHHRYSCSCIVAVAIHEQLKSGFIPFVGATDMAVEGGRLYAAGTHTGKRLIWMFDSQKTASRRPELRAMLPATIEVMGLDEYFKEGI